MTSDTVVDAEPAAADQEPTSGRRSWRRIVVYGLLPGLALLLALGAGYMKWQSVIPGDDANARIESLQVAKDSTVALLSYQPDTVEKQVDDARELLTGDFKADYVKLTDEVVIPGAKAKHISAVATVPAAASVSADEEHAVALVFVNQTTVTAGGAPAASTSTVRVTMDKVDGHWLISHFDPV